MTVRRSQGVPRSGFTLVELLVVITIIAILISLLLAAVMKVLDRMPEVQTRTEISELDSALGAFMADFNLSDPPPSTLTLNTSISSYPAGDPSLAFLYKMFGKNLGYPSGTVNWGVNGTLSGEQCLVFYLSGINNQGFSYNNVNPVPSSGQRTRGPYFTFQTTRLVTPSSIGLTTPTQYPVYLDPWTAKNKPRMPYAYFSTNGINNAYNPANCVSGAAPYYTAVGQYIYPNKYQIISAGRFGVFGNGSMPGGAPIVTGDGGDDQANFSSTLLKAGLN